MTRIATRLRDYDELIGNIVELNSSLTKKITITLFDGLRGDRYDQDTLAMHDLARKIEQTNARSKKRLPLIKLGVFDGPRCDANLIEITGVEGDYDGGEMGLRQAERRLRDAGVAALIHSSPSHDPEAPRWRVLCPVSRPLAPERRHKLVARLSGVLGGVLDASSFIRSQAFFIGSVGSDLTPTVILVDGRPIDLCDDLDAGAIGPDERADVVSEPAEPMGLKLSQVARMLDDLTDMRDRYEDWRDVAMAVHHEFDGSESAWEVIDEWSRDGEGYDRRNNKKLWNRFDADRPGGITMRSLNAELRRRGSDAAVVHDIADEFDDLDDEPTRKCGLTFLTPDQCADLPSRGYVIKGLLAPGDVGCIFGAPGAGKSLIAPYLGYAIAQGRPAFGLRTKAGGVFYVAAEDSVGMRGRVTALKRAHGTATDFTLVEGVSDLLTKDSSNLKALLSAVAERKPALIVIDTLAMAFPGLEENSAEAMGRVVAVSRALTKHGAAVLLIHHDTKAEGGTPRGHSLLNGALDVAIRVVRDDQGVVRGRLTKNRNGACDLDIAFRISVETIGEDDDGDAMTAARCDPLAHFAERREPPSPKEYEALSTLRRLTRRKSEGAALHEWRDAYASARKDDNRETQRKSFRRALDGLVRKRWVQNRGGYFLPSNSSREIAEPNWGDADDDLI